MTLFDLRKRKVEHKCLSSQPLSLPVEQSKKNCSATWLLCLLVEQPCFQTYRVNHVFLWEFPPPPSLRRKYIYPETGIISCDRKFETYKIQLYLQWKWHEKSRQRGFIPDRFPVRLQYFVSIVLSLNETW